MKNFATFISSSLELSGVVANLRRDKSIMDNLTNAGIFNTLLRAIKTTDLNTVLSDQGPVTFFAPSDYAFKKMSKIELQKLLKDKNRLTALIKGHMVYDILTTDDLLSKDSIDNINGNTLKIDSTDGLKINNIKVAEPDIQCNNGIIHAIEGVLKP